MSIRVFFCILTFNLTQAFAESIDMPFEVRSTLGELKSQKSSKPLSFGFKTQNFFGPVSQMGSFFRSKEEIYFGVRSADGWGFMISESYNLSSRSRRPKEGAQDVAAVDGNAPANVNKKLSSSRGAASVGGKPATLTEKSNQGVDEALSMADPTNQNSAGFQDLNLQLFHPISKDDSQSLSGMLRSSLPTTERSQANSNVSLGYSMIYSLKFAKKWSFSTVVTLNYFSRSTYAPPFDSIYGMGLINSFNHRLNSWLKLGGGQRSGLINRTQSPTGASTEIFSTADFTLSPSVFMGPRVHFPIYSEGAAFSDVPTRAAIQNISADLFMQVSI